MAESWATTPAVRRIMQGNKRRDTKPELALRRALHSMGLRYRVDTPPERGIRRRADIVFRPAKVVVEVRGCYWHGCPEHYRPSTANVEFWKTKIERNRERDAEGDSALASAGWLVIVIWEHDNVSTAAQAIEHAVTQRRGVKMH